MVKERSLYSIWSWSVSLFLLSIVDYVCTKYGIQKGFFREANPAMEYIIRHMGIEGILLVKMSTIVFLGICLRIAYNRKPEILPRIRKYVILATVLQFAISLFGVTMIMFWWRING